MFDVIGDIHGQGDALEKLLTRLGYRHERGAYRHDERRVIFVGDFVDRGPKIKKVLEIVRPMVEEDAALAVMGNHEFNMIALHTSDGSGGHLRPREYKNIRQARETIAQLKDDEIADYVEWFRGLPMWLEVDGLRIVHASWIEPQMEVIAKHRQQAGGCTDAFVAQACKRGSDLFLAIDDVLKGTEAQLPDGLTFLDKDGHERNKARTRWYLDAQNPDLTWRQYAMCFHERERLAMPDCHLPADWNFERSEYAGYPADAPPVIFGHYWVPPEDGYLKPLADNVACVDLSAGKGDGGKLCAYRWDGEQTLSAEHFVAVDVS